MTAQLATRAARTLGAVRRALALASRLALLAIMFGVSLDALLRYVTGSPVAGMLEGVELLLVIVVFANLAQTQADGGNIAVTALTERVRGRWADCVRLVVSSLALALAAAMTWASAGLAWRSWQMREFSAGLVSFPIYPSRIVISLGLLILSLHFLGTLAAAVVRLAAPRTERA